VQENLTLYADLHGVPMEQRRAFSRMLEMTDMARFAASAKAVGGMKRSSACLHWSARDLLLLDEPSVGVDPLSRRDLRPSSNN
jgi:ABC-2 type transport system ATP-binding protein